jgi:hypothetical protein
MSKQSIWNKDPYKVKKGEIRGEINEISDERIRSLIPSTNTLAKVSTYI